MKGYSSFFIISVVILCSVCQGITWTNGFGDRLWTAGGNWDLNRQPSSSDNVSISLNGTNRCILDGTGYADWILMGETATGHLQITGSAQLNVNASFKIGNNLNDPSLNLVEVRDDAQVELSLADTGFLQIAHINGTQGRLELHENAFVHTVKRTNIGNRANGQLAVYDNGHFKSEGAVYVGNQSGSSGTIEMHGGTFEMTGYVLYVGAVSGSTGHIQADGGQILVRDLVLGSGGTIDVTKGSLFVNQGSANWSAFKTSIQNAHAAGQITGYGNSANVLFDWDEEGYDLTITAIRDLRMARPLGPPNGGEETPGWKLVWEEGANGPYTHDVYLGRDPDAVTYADKSPGPCPGAGSLNGDLDGDCHVDMYDAHEMAKLWIAPYDLDEFAQMAAHWLLSNPYKGNQSDMEYAFGDLKAGETYYWRIDEVAGDSTVIEGDPMSFTVIPAWQQDEFIISIGWTDLFDSSDRAGYIQKLVELGINNVAEVTQTFDQCTAAGLSVMLKNKPSHAFAADFKDRPGFWGYWQEDEPNPGSEFEQVGQDHLLAHWADPRHPSYTNLQSINYGIDRSDVYDFIDIVNPEVLSFDFYQWYWGIGYPFKTLIENLEFYREVALANNIPLHSWVEVDADSNAENVGTAENRARYRYSVYMNLTYGVKGIFWFTASKMFNKDGGYVTKQGYYDDVQIINQEIANLGPELVQLTSTAVYHTGIGSVPYDHSSSMNSIPGGHWIQIVEDGFALGMFTNEDGDDYAMVMNRDKNDAHTATLQFPVDPVTQVKIFDATAGTWSNLPISGVYPNQSVSVVLDPGADDPDGGLGKLIEVIR